MQREQNRLRNFHATPGRLPLAALLVGCAFFAPAMAAEPGDPVEAVGVFQACAPKGADKVCYLLGTEEENYTVLLNAKTPAKARTALEAAEKFSTVIVDGELIGYGGLTTDITASEVTMETYKAGSDDQKANQLAGFWNSREDEQSSLQFIGDRYNDYYEGDVQEKGSFALATSCADSHSDKPESLLVKTGEDGTEYCYNIVTLNDTTLELIFLPGGNILTYSRVEQEWRPDAQ